MDGALTVSSVIWADDESPVPGFVKTGVGTLILSGNNSFRGPVTISSGNLLVNGSIATSSGVSVAAGATLGGSGTVSAISGAAW